MSGSEPGGVDSSTAGVEAAEQFSGSPAFEAACAHSDLARARKMGNEALATQAKKTYQRFRANAGLRRDEWKFIDDTLKTASQARLTAVDDLRGRGLTIPLDLGTLRYEYETMADMNTGAEVDMSAEVGGNEDLPTFSSDGVPLPLVHKSFRINERKLRASRRLGEPLDTTAARAATRIVAEGLEDIVYNGVAGLNVGGDQIYGYTNHPNRNPVTANAAWSAATADNILDDVMRTVEAMENDYTARGNWVLYVSRGPLQEARAKNSGTDDKTGVLQHLRNRLSGEAESDWPGLQIKMADYLDDGEAVLVDLSAETVQLAVPSDFQTLNWEQNGGMTNRYKVMASMIPVLKPDSAGQLGVVHLTGI